MRMSDEKRIAALRVVRGALGVASLTTLLVTISFGVWAPQPPHLATLKAVGTIGALVVWIGAIVFDSLVVRRRTLPKVVTLMLLIVGTFIAGLVYFGVVAVWWRPGPVSSPDDAPAEAG